MNHSDRKLPRCVYKAELIQYFGCSYDYLWANVITDDMIRLWGYDIDNVKRLRQLPPDLTERIYVHFRILDLNQDNSRHIERVIQEFGQIAC